jgi:hypothetical protein
MIIEREAVKKVLLAEHRVIMAIQGEGMTLDDFSSIEYLGMVCDAIEHPTDFRVK